MFKESVAMQYIDFMPGKYFPQTNYDHLQILHSFARKNNIAIGAPELLPAEKGLTNNRYHFIHQDTTLIIGATVQQGNYRQTNPKNYKRFTIGQLNDFAENYLGAEYIFWSIQEPFYTSYLMPFLRKRIQEKKDLLKK